MDPTARSVGTPRTDGQPMRDREKERWTPLRPTLLAASHHWKVAAFPHTTFTRVHTVLEE